MGLALGKTRHSPIAVDFGSDSLKLLQVIPGDPPELVAAAGAVVPDEARKDADARNQFYITALKQLLRKHPFKGKRAICSMPAYEMLIQHMQLNKGDDIEIRGQIEQALLSRMNLDPSRLVIRHMVVSNATHDSGSKLEVICMAAGYDSVMGRIDAVRKAHLEVVGMHSEPMAMMKAFAHLYRRPDDASRTTCFLDVGSAATKVIISHGAEIVFAKTIQAAGEHLTKCLCKSKGMGYGRAREQRVNEAVMPTARVPMPNLAPAATAVAAPAPKPSGFALLDAQIAAENVKASDPLAAPLPDDPDAPRPEDETPQDLYADVLDMLVDELQMCLRYHQSLFPQRPIEKLVFLGGESHHVEICQRIAQSVRVGAQLGDPLARLIKKKPGKSTDLDMRKPQPGWAVPFGLSISEANL